LCDDIKFGNWSGSNWQAVYDQRFLLST